MEKQRINAIFNNLNMKTDNIRFPYRNDLQNNSQSATSRNIVTHKEMTPLRPVRKVCRKLIFDSVQYDLPSIITNSALIHPYPVQRASPTKNLISQEYSQQCTADILTGDSLQATKYNEISLQDTDKDVPTALEKNNEHFSHRHATAIKKYNLVHENFQVASLKSLCSQIINKIPMPKSTGPSPLPFAKQIHKERSSYPPIAINTEEILSGNRFQPNVVHMPFAVTSKSSPPIEFEYQDTPSISTAILASLGSKTSKIHNSLICNIDLSRLNLNLVNKLIGGAIPHNQQTVDTPLQLNSNDGNRIQIISNILLPYSTGRPSISYVEQIKKDHCSHSFDSSVAMSTEKITNISLLNKLTCSMPQEQQEINTSLQLNSNDGNDINVSPPAVSDIHFNDLYSNDSSTDNIQKTTRKVIKSKYIISPLHSEESDADISDTDPTYYEGMDDKGKRPLPLLLLSPSRRNRSLSSTSSSSDSSDTSSVSIQRSTTPERKTRKRKRNPKSWMYNTAKRLRNSGQSYVSVKTKKIVEARSVKPPCSNKCRLKCSQKFTSQDRNVRFHKFWSLENVDLQRAYIKSCMVEVKPKYKYSATENPRKCNNAFYLQQDSIKLRVCKTFFINTLDISDRMIRTVKEKSDVHNFLAKDKRGKHENHKRIDPVLASDVKSFIDSIPRIESHYTRATSSCEYISASKTLTEIYQDFVALQQENGRPSGKFCNFYEIFKNTGIKMHQPKKDMCDLCTQYKLTSDKELKKEYDEHLEEKELSREEKRKDRYNIDENNICAIYDLQAILQAPNSNGSSFYYKSKMNCYNFTITELAKKNKSDEENNKAYTNVYCYFWDETQGQKGSTEIASCVLNFLKLISERPTSESVTVTFYSDNCCGQNKNKFIATLYMYALTQYKNINSIIHKFLIKGHTQNENDNVHSLIEKEIKKYLKADSIFTPVQYIPLIQSAKKTGQKFKVNTMTFEDFIDVKNLQTQWGPNFTKDRNRNPLSWNDVKILEFREDEPFKFYFKASYKEKEYREVDVRAGLRKSLPTAKDMILRKAYRQRFELNENKKKDLKILIDKKSIPPYYVHYYYDLI